MSEAAASSRGSGPLGSFTCRRWDNVSFPGVNLLLHWVETHKCIEIHWAALEGAETKSQGL